MNVHIYRPQRPIVRAVEQYEAKKQEEEKPMDANWIIENKPDVKYVRAYFKELVKGITDD